MKVSTTQFSKYKNVVFNKNCHQVQWSCLPNRFELQRILKTIVIEVHVALELMSQLPYFFSIYRKNALLK